MSTSSARDSAPAAGAAPRSTSSAEPHAPTAVAASACPPPAVWSDDLGSALPSGGGAGMVVVRDCRIGPESTAAVVAAPVASASTAREAHPAQQSSGIVTASATCQLTPAQPGLAVLAHTSACPAAASEEAAGRHPAAVAKPPAASGPSLGTLAKWAEVAARVAAARLVPLFFLSLWLAGAIWGALFLSWSSLSSSLLLHSLSIPLLVGMLLLLSGGLAATLYSEQARRRSQAVA